tara:strand:+ start:26667 stop:27731 length:1065 start_codon:yes stop_codon:yes gene_type:complete
METYLVGGAVRDQLLGLKVLDRDWVVVGSTEEAMLDLGYERVGKDFPVFLHPKSKEEYALARTERKTAPGHKGFECDASESVTLEEDLMRRDLTINAIAQSTSGKLIDPQNGVSDIQQKILRHVSPAFSEDPLRILRLARFYARFPEFTVAPETFELLRQMIEANLLQELAKERVWIEITKALQTNHPARFFQLLSDLGAHDQLWPVIAKSQITQLDTLASEIKEPELRFASLFFHCHDGAVQHLKQNKVPNAYSDLALATSQHMESLLQSAPNPDSILELLTKLDALRRPERFQQLLKLGQVLSEKPALFDWNRFLLIIQNISSDQVDANLKGKAFGAALIDLRLAAIKSASA